MSARAIRAFGTVFMPIVALAAAVLFPFDVAAGSVVGSIASASAVLCGVLTFRTARRLPR